MKNILLLILLVCIEQEYAQTFDWAHGFGVTGSSSSTQGNSITHDNNGNAIVTGIFQGTIDFNPGAATDTLNSIGSMGIFVSKYDAVGNYLWAFRIGGPANYQATSQSVSVDVMGNICITGWLTGSADFDPSPSTHQLSPWGTPNMFLAKYDSNGNYLWAFCLGDTNAYYQETSYSTTFDINGNIFITGAFQDTVDFDPSASSVHNLIADSFPNMFVAKYNTNGNYIWAFRIGNPTGTVGYALCTDKNGDVIVTGSFGNTVDFNPAISANNLTAKGLSDIFIAKYDSSGHYLWAFNIGAPSLSAQCNGWSVSCDTACNVYATGYFEGNNDFNPGAGTNYLFGAQFGSAYLAKYDVNGNYLWALRIGNSTDPSVGSSVYADSVGNVLITGGFKGTVNFNSTGSNYITAKGTSDIFLADYDRNGNYLWAFNVGASGSGGGGISVTADNNGNIWMTGSFGYSNNDFDPTANTYNLSGQGNHNIFIAKYSYSTTGIQQAVINSDKIVVYPNPTSDQFFIDANTTDKLTVDLYDVNGRRVFNKIFIGTVDIDVNNLDNGIYTLTIKNSFSITNKKLVIAR